jgi:hypothetical protein
MLISKGFKKLRSQFMVAAAVDSLLPAAAGMAWAENYDAEAFLEHASLAMGGADVNSHTHFDHSGGRHDRHAGAEPSVLPEGAGQSQ